MCLLNYGKNYYIYKLIMSLLCAMNSSKYFIYVILVILHKNSHENKEGGIIPILQIRLTKVQ